MRAERPSRTARFVALGRALADAGVSHVRGFHDPTARVFLDAKRRRIVAKMERAVGEGKRGIRLELARGAGDLMALRTLAIDEAVREAIAGSAKQLVILGAGYDGRAWRMPELAGVKVFEVDHPATQGNKRRHVAELPPPNADVRFVSIDFERESLDEVLERAGHDRSLPTCWIWEGVVMYLTHAAMLATLASVAGRSAAGSTLIVNYHVPHRRPLARLLLRFIGEPQLSAWTPEQMAADLRSVGFDVRKDSGTLDWNTQFAESKAKVDRASYMRVVVAQNAAVSSAAQARR